jgi:hypothetical protein
MGLALNAKLVWMIAFFGIGRYAHAEAGWVPSGVWPDRADRTSGEPD